VSIDLHIHSTASDGTDSPAEVARIASEAGLTAFALTDHDTLAGIAEAKAAGKELGIEVVPGVELSVDHGAAKMHMLVYFLEPGPGPLQDRLVELREGRAIRNREIVERLAAMGYDIDMDAVIAQAGGESVGRPHIADALVAQGAFPDRASVFSSLLRDGGPAYVERLRLTAAEAITLARRGHAVPVVAHPSTIDVARGGYGPLFRELADLGLGGIEVEYPEHPPALRAALRKLTEALGLVATGGSDYHGRGKPGIHVGTGRGNLDVPDAVLDELRSRR